jgi:hypothetical protein
MMTYASTTNCGCSKKGKRFFPASLFCRHPDKRCSCQEHVPVTNLMACKFHGYKWYKESNPHLPCAKSIGFEIEIS